MPSSLHDRNPHARRQAPRPREVFELLRLERPSFDLTKRRLRRATDIAELREAARRATPRAVFDYVDGSADSETSINAFREEYRRIEFRPRVLRDVADVDPTTTILGCRSRLPLAFGPTGYTRMMHHEGEIAVGRAAARLGVPYTLSTVGTTSPEDLRRACPDTELWFQLYLWSDRAASERLIERVRDAGYTTLILTVDTPVTGNRRRDARNGLTIPPELTLSTVGDMALHPRWWINKLTTSRMRFECTPSEWGTDEATLYGSMFDAGIDFDDLEWVRALWPGTLVVKGVQTIDDAKAVVESGADAVVLSNHGGRQMDQGAPVLRILPDVAEAVGDKADVLIDSGIMRGNDVLAAHCLGADGVLVGRAYLYGLMAGGERGVERVGEILDHEIRTSMALLGARTVDELTPDLVRLP